MAHAAGILAGVNWAQHAQTAWTWSKARGQTSLAYLTTLPRTCFLASAHAAWVCTGGEPEYSLPGFAPFVYGWGWLLLGIATGVILTWLALYCTGYIRRDIPVSTLARIATPTPPGLNLSPQAPPQDVLNYLATGGRPALQDLASGTGMTEADFLLKVFGAPQNNLQNSGTVHQFGSVPHNFR